MGLTNWKPAFKVTVNGQDRTSVFLPRVRSIRVTDTAGIQSDTCDILLSDHLPSLPIELPPAGAEITIAFGYLFAAQLMGVYIADEVEILGPPGQMRITGYAAAHGTSAGGKKPVSTARTRSWQDGTTIEAMVTTIAAESGFRAAVSADAGKVVLPHIDQIDESDMNLLTRVARDHGLIFKPAGGALVIWKPGEGTTTAGRALPVVSLTPNDVTAWSMRRARRQAYDKVVATYRDFNQSESIDVEVDARPPGVTGVAQVRRLKPVYPSERSARAAAAAEAGRSQRGTTTLRLTLPGRADLQAEGRLRLSRFRPGVDGEWLVTAVQHSLDESGWIATVDAEMS
ncbi:phage late control D family protein [Paracoccus sp. SMMA_5]|uniref:phage late control D family protein n=1 Tax=Paracoccus sp. SMMA_5 TaxID=2654281 RepID=UPI0018A6C6D0|nr:contractile injection system protein, VgrG/Pvc8 family [Paracoccus sp. SMMA_5]UXU73719.1 contractile injection system protein, VgrG/Pvc8 family [Paracoccus sp. SMMA_5]